MVYAAPGSVTYLQVNPGDGRRAADRITTPTSAAIVAATAAFAPPAKPSKPSAPPAKSAGTTAGGRERGLGGRHHDVKPERPQEPAARDTRRRGGADRHAS